MFKTLVATAFALFAASSSFAAGSPVSETDLKGIRVALEDHLKDADSAKLKNVRAKDGTVCGMVNAKNSYGAYAGFTPFLALKLSSGKYMVIGVDEATGKVCADRGI